MSNLALKEEFGKIKKNKMLIASLIALLFIPIMYGGFFLGSVWDPYGNTKNLPVAVVNEDSGAKMNGKDVNVGKELVENLKSNDKMGWNFVSKSDAEKGLEEGKYYTMVRIPDNFSKRAASITSENPEKSMIEYTVTPDRNYVASLLTSQAAKEIKQNVSKTLTNSYVSVILKSMNTASDGMSQAADGARQIKSGSGELNSGINKYTSGVSQLNSGGKTLVNGLGQIENGSSQLQNGLAQLQTGLPNSTDISQLQNGMNQVSAGVNQLNYSLNNPSPEMTNSQANLSAKAGVLSQNMQEYFTNFEIAKTSGSLERLNNFANNNDNNFTQTDAQNILKLTNSSLKLANSQLEFSNSFAEFQTVLANNQSQLKSAVAGLNSGINVLSPQTNKALGGYLTVNSALGTLNSGSQTLTNSITSAKNGSESLISGLSQLENNSSALKSGGLKLENGANELAGKLDDAAGKLEMKEEKASKMTSQISEPAKIEEFSAGNVKIYGYALSPYVLSIGLFVGALSFNIIYPVSEISKKEKAGKQWVSKAAIAGAVSVGQALVMSAIMIFGLGLHPDNILAFIMMSIVTSAAFMAIIMFLSIALDNVGRFLAMLLLVLQLGSAEGVFPISLSPAFFQALNPLVPMTYSIRGFKAVISSNLPSDMFWMSLIILVAVVLLFNVFLWVYLKVKK